MTLGEWFLFEALPDRAGCDCLGCADAAAQVRAHLGATSAAPSGVPQAFGSTVLGKAVLD